MPRPYAQLNCNPGVNCQMTVPFEEDENSSSTQTFQLIISPVYSADFFFFNFSFFPPLKLKSARERQKSELTGRQAEKADNSEGTAHRLHCQTQKNDPYSSKCCKSHTRSVLSDTAGTLSCVGVRTEDTRRLFMEDGELSRVGDTSAER